MRSVRLLARGLKYAALALQLPAYERDWSGERMLRHVLGVGPRRFWWLDLVSNPIVIAWSCLSPFRPRIRLQIFLPRGCWSVLRWRRRCSSAGQGKGQWPRRLDNLKPVTSFAI